MSIRTGKARTGIHSPRLSMFIRNREKRGRRLFRFILILFLLGVFAVIFADHAVNKSAEGRIYDNVEEVPHKKVALLLGSNKYIADGRENLFYNYRIDATIDLYNAGKVDYILISGDNGTLEYSEPELMQTDLVADGIPEDRIYLDFAGFRTWDSVIRANKVFLGNDFLIISQAFHTKRALYIAKAHGIEAIAFNTKDVPVVLSPRIWVRERLARVKVVLDVFLRTQPKFLGEPITIGEEAEGN